jgi:glutamine synthetase
VPSRNRSVLIGVVRETGNPLATRFELRAPNPNTNTYIALGALYLAMTDGIEYAVKNNKTEDELLKELSKKREKLQITLKKTESTEAKLTYLIIY